MKKSKVIEVSNSAHPLVFSTLRVLYNLCCIPKKKKYIYSTLSVCLILRGDFSVIAGVRGHSLLHHFKLVGMKGISECISKLLRTFGKRRSDETNRSYSALPCRRFSLTEIKTATNNFDDNLFIGCCGDWKVYNGFIDDPVRSVAISRVNIESTQGFHEFRTEALVLCQVRHPNLVPFIGYCLAKRYGFLVYEFMVNSNLARHLNGTNPDPNPNPIPWKRRLKICVGVARGLHYLHTGLKHTIVHSGVDPTNILLDAKWEAKLSNLGLSKMGPPSLSKALIRIETDRVVGTYGYMDQEYVMFGKLNDKSDVYSFGVVLLQLLSGITPSPFAGPMDLVGLARKCKREGTI